MIWDFSAPSHNSYVEWWSGWLTEHLREKLKENRSSIGQQETVLRQTIGWSGYITFPSKIGGLDEQLSCCGWPHGLDAWRGSQVGGRDEPNWLGSLSRSKLGGLGTTYILFLYQKEYNFNNTGLRPYFLLCNIYLSFTSSLRHCLK